MRDELLVTILFHDEWTELLMNIHAYEQNTRVKIYLIIIYFILYLCEYIYLWKQILASGSPLNNIWEIYEK